MVFTVERMVTVKNFHMSTGYPCWKHVGPRVGQCQFITQLSQYSLVRRRCEDPNPVKLAASPTFLDKEIV